MKVFTGIDYTVTVDLEDVIGQTAMIAWDRDTGGAVVFASNETCKYRNTCPFGSDSINPYNGLYGSVYVDHLPSWYSWGTQGGMLTDGHGIGWVWTPDQSNELTGYWVTLSQHHQHHRAKYGIHAVPDIVPVP